MSKFFECVRCGVITPVELSPPRCSSCGHGTGILHTNDPRSSAQGAGKVEKPAASDGKDPSATVDVIPTKAGI